jgi:hypothetical protein
LIMSALKPGAHEAKKDGNKKELVETGWLLSLYLRYLRSSNDSYLCEFGDLIDHYNAWQW